MSLLDKATIHPVDTDFLDYYWPLVSSYIQDALEHTDGEIDLSGVLSDIANHERQLWVIKHSNEYIAAVVTYIYTTDTNLKIGEITLAGGSKHELWDHFVDQITQWLKSQGCNFIDIVGRVGWARHYKKQGFKVKYQILRKAV